MRLAQYLMLAFIVAQSPFLHANFVRTGNDRYVELHHGRARVQFDTWYGGAPLHWWIDGVHVLSPPPAAGTGFQLTVDTGQDITQAGANGITPFPIARLSDSPAQAAYDNYFAREVELTNSVYRVVGFAPFFWASLDAVDDVVPPKSDGQDQTAWLTYYNSGDVQPRFFTGPGVPLLFRGSAASPSGIIMVGDTLEMVARPNGHWVDQLLRIPEGRLAARINVSLRDAAPGSFAGILFRKKVPQNGSTMDDVFFAEGYSLNVNREGTLQLLRTDAARRSEVVFESVAPTIRQTINTEFGALLEIRTRNFAPGLIEIWVNRQRVGQWTDPNPILGEHTGLLAATTPGGGDVKFSNREIFDVGVEFECSYRPAVGGAIDVEMEIRNAPGVSGERRFYRMNTVAFLDSGSNPSLNTIWTECETGSVWGPKATTGQYVVPIGDAPGARDALWAGEGDGSLGVRAFSIEALIDGSISRGSHALLATGGTLIHLNALPVEANQSPILASRITLRSRWSFSSPGTLGSDCNRNGVPDSCEDDSDEDGTIDECDGCPLDSAKTSPGSCGCGEPEVPGCGATQDSDGDGVPDAEDNCPGDSNPFQEDCDSDRVGDACSRDSDGDETPDSCDECPLDPEKTSPGDCGCGNPEIPGCGRRAWIELHDVGRGEVLVRVGGPIGVKGGQFGLGWSSDAVTFIEAELGPAVTDPDALLVAQVDPVSRCGPEVLSGVTLAWLNSQSRSVVLPETEGGHDVLLLRFNASEPVQIQFVECLEDPPIESLVVDASDRAIPADTRGVELEPFEGGSFVRGDVNVDGGQDISDVSFLLNHLFIGTSSPPCLSAADVDDDGLVNLTDAIYLLQWRFLGGATPAVPFLDCGADPTEDALNCASFLNCD